MLLVEDDRIMQLAASSIFHKLNCNVNIAGTGKEAISLFKKVDYDLILMDIGLPDINGFTVTKIIRSYEKGANIPILALTAHAIDDVLDDCIKAAMDDVLAKPLKYDRAVALLNKYIYSRQIANDGVVDTDSGSNFLNIDSNIVNIKACLSKQDSFNEVSQYLHLIASYVPEFVGKIKALLSQCSYSDIVIETHKLKGTLSLVSLPRLEEAASLLCKKANDHPPNVVTIQTSFEKIIQCSDEFLTELKKLSSVVKNTP